jgi:type VI secretion system protein VasD
VTNRGQIGRGRIGRGPGGFLLALALASATTACGGPPPPTLVKVAVKAADTANAEQGGPGRPVRVRVLRLAGTQGFMQADFFSLDADPKKALGQDLLGADDILLAPGKSKTYERTCEPDVHFLGVVAAFGAIDEAKWRAVQPVKANKTNQYTATLDTAELTLKPGSGS